MQRKELAAVQSAAAIGWIIKSVAVGIQSRTDHEFFVHGKRGLIKLLVTAIGLKSEMNPVSSLTR